MDDLNLGAFKAYDIRTKIENLPLELEIRLCQSVARYMKFSLKADTVVICRDARLYVPQLAETLITALVNLGINVKVNPLPISTCQFYFTMMQNRMAAGVMLTASHNAGNYVGMKLLAQDLNPIAYGYGVDGGIARIKELYLEDKYVSEPVKGKVATVNCLDEFISYSLDLAGIEAGSLKGQKIFFEFLSGSSGLEVAQAFQYAGAEVTFSNLLPNGFFPQGDPNPIIEKSIAPARAKMKEGNFDFGFCFDGDGDRLDLMDSEGKQVIPGYNMSVLVPSINDIFKKAFPSFNPQYYADVKAIPTALKAISDNGVGLHIIRNGHSFIKAKLKENFVHQYLAAEEESAHYYMNFPYDKNDFSKGVASIENTLFFSLLTSKCHRENAEKYKAFKKEEESLYREREWPVYCEAKPEIMQTLMDEVEKKMSSFGATVIKKMDDGSDLDAVLMRINLPSQITADSSFGKEWVQIAERISRSEDAMVRWEVVSNSE